MEPGDRNQLKKLVEVINKKSFLLKERDIKKNIANLQPCKEINILFYNLDICISGTNIPILNGISCRSESSNIKRGLGKNKADFQPRVIEN